MQTRTTTTVTADLVDDLNHMNHALGLRLLEYARDEWYRQAGLWEGRPWSSDEHFATIVLNINMNYRLECFREETLSVLTEPGTHGSKSYTLSQQLLKANGEVAIEGTCTSLIMDMRTHETLAVPEALACHFPGE